jgi:hypothetical protein
LRKLGRSEWEGELGASILTLYSFPFVENSHSHFNSSEITFLKLTVAADRTSFSDLSLWMMVSSSRDVSIASIVLITEGLEANVF